MIELDRWQREIRDLVIEDLKALRKGEGLTTAKLSQQSRLMRMFDRDSRAALQFIKNWLEDQQGSKTYQPDIEALVRAYNLVPGVAPAAELTDRRYRLSLKLAVSTRTIITREDKAIKRLASTLTVKFGEKLNVGRGNQTASSSSSRSSRGSVDPSRMSLKDALDAQSTVNRQISDANTELKGILRKIDDLKKQQTEVIKHLGGLQDQSAQIQKRISEG